MCGRGRIFQSLFRLRDSCPECGWWIEREPGTVTGPMYLVSVLTLPFAALVFLALWLLTDWPTGAKIAVGVPVILLFCVPALWISKGVWAAVEYHTDIAAGDTRRRDYADKAFRE